MTPEATIQQWVRRWVIRHTLCPFAARVDREDEIGYEVCRAHTAEDAFAEVMQRTGRYLADWATEKETLLLLFPAAFPEFPDFNDFVEDVNYGLEESGAGELLQTASFHPGKYFAGTAPDDYGNGTDRSPLPVLQLLRCSDVAAAIASHPDTDRISDRNIAYLRARQLRPPFAHD